MVTLIWNLRSWNHIFSWMAWSQLSFGATHKSLSWLKIFVCNYLDFTKFFKGTLLWKSNGDHAMTPRTMKSHFFGMMENSLNFNSHFGLNYITSTMFKICQIEKWTKFFLSTLVGKILAIYRLILSLVEELSL
jgi:hypothetical protein